MSDTASSGYSSDITVQTSHGEDSQDGVHTRPGGGMQVDMGNIHNSYMYDNVKSSPNKRRNDSKGDLAASDTDKTYTTVDDANNEFPYDYILDPVVWKKNRTRTLPPLPDEPEENRPYRRYVVVCLTIVLLAAGAGLIYARLSCRIGLCSNQPDTEGPLGWQCDKTRAVELDSATSFTCVLELDNPTTLKLTQGGSGVNSIDITNDFNTTLTHRIDDRMNVVISRDNTEIHINIEFTGVKCSVQGTYSIVITNGTHNATYTVEVEIKPGTSFCPCDVLTTVGVKEKIVCNVETGDDDLVEIRRPSDTNSSVFEPMFGENGDDMSVWNISSRETLSVTLSNEGHSTLSLEFAHISCIDGGIYSITAGNRTYETSIQVQSFPKIPILTANHDKRDGLVAGYDGQIQCQAEMGCSNAITLKLLSKNVNRLEFEEIQLKGTVDSTLTGNVVTLHHDIDSRILSLMDKSEFKCSYTDEKGQPKESDVFVARVIPGNFCKVIEYGCEVTHPFDCDKYVTCTTKPVERLCPEGLHWHQKDTCSGECDYPTTAKCTPEN